MVGDWFTETKMILPIEWLKEYVDTSKTPTEIANSLTSLGLMLDRPIVNDVLDLEHRMDRSDWLSIIGCARDFAAMEDIKLKLPESLIPESNGNGGIDVVIEAKDLVRRFNTRVFKNVRVGESPEWLKNRLEQYGIASKNNVVDITNYVMLEYGQPMHAQDINKFKNKKIVFRRAKKGEVCTTLLGENVELDEETLVMTDGEQIIGIGAIVGGRATAVDENTTQIVLDAGNYNQANIRKTSRRLNIRNETVLRTEKFLHPHLTQVAIERATKLLIDLADAEYYENVDYYPQEAELQTMQLRFSRIKAIGGIDVEQEKIKQILKSLEYGIKDENSEGMKLEIPYFRTDVLVEDDIVADILRINNYVNIPNELISEAPPKEVTPEIYRFEDKIRDELVKLGVHEHITNPVVKLDKNEKLQIELDNALNSEQNALRLTIKETLEPVMEVYKKHKITSIKLFEVGLSYELDGNSYNEIRKVEVVVDINGNISESNTELKQILSGLLFNLGIHGTSLKRIDEKVQIFQNKTLLGDLKANSFMLFTNQLLEAEKQNKKTKDTIMHISTKDLTVDVKANTPLGGIVEEIYKASNKVTLVELVDKFQKDNTDAITFRITLEDFDEISDEEIEKIRKAVK